MEFDGGTYGLSSRSNDNNNEEEEEENVVDEDVVEEIVADDIGDSSRTDGLSQLFRGYLRNGQYPVGGQ